MKIHGVLVVLNVLQEYQILKFLKVQNKNILILIPVKVIFYVIAAVIQARMNSSRLPGKIMLKVCNKTLLEHMIDRIKLSKTIDKIIIATTINNQDNEIESFCDKKKIDCFRGSENDVLERYFEVSKKYSVDTIVRLTSDTPLIDPDIIDEVVNYYKNHNFDYVSNIFPLPRTFPDGFNVEIFSSKVLERAHLESERPSDREHVTNYISMQPKIFSIGKINYKKDISKYRLNLDYQEDFLLIKKILETLYDTKKIFHLEDIIKILEDNPDIIKLNSQVKSYENILKSFEKDKKIGFNNRKGNYYFN